MYGVRKRTTHRKGGVTIEHHEVHRIEHHPAKAPARRAPARRRRTSRYEY